MRFTWFGIVLDDHDTISFFALADGASWATIVRPDGTHMVAAAEAVLCDPQPTRIGRVVPARWTLTIPALSARLEIVRGSIMDSHAIWTGALVVEGIYANTSIRGSDFCDIVGPAAC